MTPCSHPVRVPTSWSISKFVLRQHTEELVFPGRDFDGSIPSFLGQLSKLTALYLADCNLTGRIPTQLGLLSNLGKHQSRARCSLLEQLLYSHSLPFFNVELLHLGQNRLTGKVCAERLVYCSVVFCVMPMFMLVC